MGQKLCHSYLLNLPAFRPPPASCLKQSLSQYVFVRGMIFFYLFNKLLGHPGEPGWMLCV